MGYQVYLSLKGWQIVLCRVGELLLYKRTCWLEWPKETELLRLLSRYLIIVLFSDSSRRTGSIWFFSFAQYFPSFSANYFTVWKWINLINIHLFICVFFCFFVFHFSWFRFWTVSLGELEVTEGGSAILPCDMSLPSLDDAIYLVVWFLEPNKKPIYT